MLVRRSAVFLLFSNAGCNASFSCFIWCCFPRSRNRTKTKRRRKRRRGRRRRRRRGRRRRRKVYSKLTQ